MRRRSVPGKGRRGFDPVRLTVFEELFAGLAEDMGEVLRLTAPSVNIRERRDFSCAVFDAGGGLVGQAAHIPVHLGSASLSVRAVRERFPDLRDGEVVLLNDPHAGGTHLPDLTLVTAVEVSPGVRWSVVNRAHHADVGGSRPGSMGTAGDLCAEGLRIPPVLLHGPGGWSEDVLALVLANTRTPAQRFGDLRAQVEANRYGAERLKFLFASQGAGACIEAVAALREKAERALLGFTRSLRHGRHRSHGILEGDGILEEDLELRLELVVSRSGRLTFDFRGSCDQTPGSLNANPAVVRAAVLYALSAAAGRGLPPQAFEGGILRILTREGSLLEPRFPAACAGGNVETSQRLVDLCLEALGRAGAEVPAESAGTMNNLSFGGRDPAGRPFAYYETLGGGAGAGPWGPGGAAVQTHMTNTRNTPIEECERNLPLVLERCEILRNSGGRGRHRGGEGMRRAYRFLVPVEVTLLADRRTHPPKGRKGGRPGRPGRQYVLAGGRRRPFPSKGSRRLEVGEVLVLETPAGGGYGRP